MNQDIMQCETEYAKCFSKAEEGSLYIRFHDDELKDMYYHNFTYIKDNVEETELPKIIEHEIALRKSKQSTFCNILMYQRYNNSFCENITYKPQVSVNGFYLFDKTKLSNIQPREDCLIQKVVNQGMIDDILYNDLQLDEAILGKDFCTRRCYRRGKVFLADEGVDSYNCYYNDTIVGNCDLFINGTVAKIEDFTVIPSEQKKGFGTAIIKSLINIAIDKGCDHIYLVTDEEDTPKEMYQKLGFQKIGERTDLFFKL